MLKLESSSTISSTSTDKISRLCQTHSNFTDWQQEQQNFVPLRGSFFVQSEHDFDLDTEVNKFIVSDKQILLLLGDSGSGKSLYTQRLASQLGSQPNPQSLIPLWISLPSLKNPESRIIEETLEKSGLTLTDIETLKSHQKFLFILDAYDEIRLLKNLFVTNQLSQWQCKIIITCRREYLYHTDNYKLYFVPFQGERALHHLYEELIVKPFNPTQIKAYVELYIQHQKPEWKNWNQYEQALDEIPGLKNLVKTPFVLKLMMEVLPEIAKHYTGKPLLERSVKCNNA